MGDQVFITPIESNGDVWTGSVIQLGVRAIREGAYQVCDWVIYNGKDIINMPTYEGSRVHNVMFQNIRKIEGVY